MNFQKLALFAILSLAEGSPLRSHRSSTSPLVDLGYAQYEGTALNTGVNQFLGIRYAAPPVDDLRWRAPHTPPRQDGIQKAQQVSATLPAFEMALPAVSV